MLLTGMGLAGPKTGKGTIRCTLTDKTVDECCCIQKNSKQYCILAKRAIDKCCCKTEGK
jgi:hypothetical protein